MSGLYMSGVDSATKSLELNVNFEKSFGYYVPTDSSGRVLNESNVELLDRPLIVNCAGYYAESFVFNTERKEGRNDYQLVYVKTGRLTLFDGDREVPAPAGSRVLLPARIPHKYTNRGCQKTSYFWIHFTGSEALSRLEEYGISPFPTVYKVRSKSGLSASFLGIFEAFVRQGEHLQRELSALLEGLLIAASRSVVRDGETYGSLSASVEYIKMNYCMPIRIGQLARLEHLSVSRYNFLFSKQFGIPPTKYIQNLRMSSARQLLASTDLLVKQIGLMCGYDDAHFFSKTFKRFYGMSPDEYRSGLSN